MKNTSTMIRMLSIPVITIAAMIQPSFCQVPAPDFDVVVTLDAKIANQKVKMRLPKDIRSGDMISGTVIEENIAAKGATKISSSTLQGVVIEIDGKQTRLSDRLFSFLVPAGVASLPFILKNAAGEVIHTGQIPVGVSPQNPLRDLWWSEQPTGSYNVPPVAQAGQPLSIPGAFDGNASNTNVSLNGKPVGFIAESPRMTVVEIPQEATAGVFEIRVEENTKKEASRVNIINLDLSAGKLSLRKGEKTTISVRVKGLEGLDLRNSNTLKLNLENQSPQTVAFSNEAGNIIIKDINEESVKDGQYEFTTRIVGVTGGSFTISSNIAAPKDDNDCVKKYQDCMAQIKADKEKGIKACQDAGGAGVDDCITKVNNAAAKLEQACLDEFLKCRK